jgi:predicted esterase
LTDRDYYRLWGNPNHLEVVAKSLRAKHPETNLHILVAKRNSGSFTYDGIERGGERVCQEIEEEIEKLGKQGQEIKRLSLVGYSLGGLVARYAVGLLDSKGFFEKITPVVSLDDSLMGVGWAVSWKKGC